MPTRQLCLTFIAAAISLAMLRAAAAQQAEFLDPHPLWLTPPQGETRWGDHDDHDDHEEEFADREEFRLARRWSRTANNFNTGGSGTPITLTWGIVRDNTATLPNEEQDNGSFRRDPSNLVSFLDSTVGNSSDSSQTNLENKSWFRLLESSYGRWAELSGVTFDYEPNDDGRDINGSTSSFFAGRNGVRADMRIAGHFIDGNSNVLAYNYLPSSGDMVIDTADTNFYRSRSNDFRALRNVLMHEIGHGLGLNHLESSNSLQLMEPFIDTSFDGPQLDDILGIQRYYGDTLEKNGGNDSRRTATQIGTFGVGDNWAIGLDGDKTLRGGIQSIVVSPDETDFVSINNNDDYYQFTLDNFASLDAILKPVGPTYNEGAQDGTQNPYVTSAFANLALDLLDENGNPLASANLTSFGESESILGLRLAPGTYYANAYSVSGTGQLYRLDLAFSQVPEPATLSLLTLALFVGIGRRRR